MGLIETEVFSPEIITDLSEISGSFEITNNNKRADEMMLILKTEGFKELGCGTNRLCVVNKAYDEKLCFLIALDKRGERDNNNEAYLTRDEILKPHIAKVKDNTSLICAQERFKKMTPKRFKKRREEYDKLIRELSKYFLIDDAGPLVWNNLGIDEETDEIKFIDYAYFCRIENLLKIKCDKCGGDLLYDKNLLYMKCDNKKCGKHFTFAQLKGQYIQDPLVEMGYQVFDNETQEEDKERKTIEDWLNN